MRRFVFYLINFIKLKSKDEDLRRREFILNVLLLGSIFLSLVSTSFLLREFIRLGSSYRGGSITFHLLILVVFISLYFFSRKGYFSVVSLVLIGLYFMPTTYAIYRWGIDLPVALLAYALIIIIAGVLLGTRFSFLITVFSSFLIISFGYLQNNYIIHPELYWKREMLHVADAVVIVCIFFVIALVSWLSNREIEKSLKRARRSEKALKKERDLLEVKVYEKTRDLKKAQLERSVQLYRFAEFGRITSGLLHDLVNPLTSIFLNLEDLKRKQKGVGKKVNSIESALNDMGRIRDIVVAGKNQIQKHEVKTIFSLNQEINSVLIMLSFKAKEARVELEFRSHSKDFQVYGDLTKFCRAVTGIISNAIDSYQGLSKKTNRRVCARILKDRGAVKIKVQDWGCGISNKNISKIFDPFFTTKDVERGTGIGLMICKDIIENNFDGKIKVKSELGEGSVFTIKLPIKKPKRDDKKH